MARSPTARILAARVLRDIERRESFSNRALSEHLERHPGMDARDRGLVTTLVYGVLRHRVRLDAHIDEHARRPKGIKGEVRQLIRIAVFEMLELQRPAPVAVAEAIKSVRGLDRQGVLTRAVQAILSATAREAEAFDKALGEGSDLDVLERRWSIPRWMAGRWVKQLGMATALKRAKALAAPPPVDLRIDLSRIDADAALARFTAEHPRARVTTVDDQPQALRTHGGGDIFYGPMHEEGLISVQGLAAQQAARLLAPAPGSRVLDACSGMGVKALQLAELMERRGTIVAADLDPKQLEETQALIARGGLDTPQLDLQVIEADLTADHPALDDAPFDSALLDVPCTGLGNLARHPEIRWSRCYDDIAERAELQRALLRRTLARVRSGGVLVYSVCSFTPEEGPNVVEEIVAEGAAVLEASTSWTPEEHATEGFFTARLRRL